MLCFIVKLSILFLVIYITGSNGFALTSRKSLIDRLRSRLKIEDKKIERISTAINRIKHDLTRFDDIKYYNYDNAKTIDDDDIYYSDHSYYDHDADEWSPLDFGHEIPVYPEQVQKIIFPFIAKKTKRKRNPVERFRDKIWLPTVWYVKHLEDMEERKNDEREIFDELLWPRTIFAFSHHKKTEVKKWQLSIWEMAVIKTYTDDGEFAKAFRALWRQDPALEIPQKSALQYFIDLVHSATHKSYRWEYINDKLRKRELFTGMGVAVTKADAKKENWHNPDNYKVLHGTLSTSRKITIPKMYAKSTGTVFTINIPKMDTLPTIAAEKAVLHNFGLLDVSWFSALPGERECLLWDTPQKWTHVYSTGKLGVIEETPEEEKEHDFEIHKSSSFSEQSGTKDVEFEQSSWTSFFKKLGGKIGKK